jgi:hypothetical protein
MERSLVEVVIWEKDPNAASEMSLSQLAVFGVRAKYTRRVMDDKFFA